MLFIAGAGSNIAQEFMQRVATRMPGEEMQRGKTAEAPLNADRYLFCAGLLNGCAIGAQSDASLFEMMKVNYIDVVVAVDKILLKNEKARVCVVGSESGYSGSYDMGYAASKAALHLFVEKRRIYERQQLVGVAPWIVGDAGMTSRRPASELDAIRRVHPKREFDTSANVAEMIYHLLYVDSGHTTGTIVRMNGGR